MRSFAVAKNVLRRILGDARTMAMIIILPLFFVLLYGNSFSGSYNALPIIIVNDDNGLASVRTAEVGRVTIAVNLAQEFIAQLDPSTFRIESSSDPEAAAAQVGNDGVLASLVFSRSFSNAVVNEALIASGERLETLEGQTVTLLPSEPVEGSSTSMVIDDSNPLIAEAILSAFQSAFAQVLATQQTSITADALLDIRPLYDGEIRILDFTAPGIIGFAMTLITVLLTAMSVVRERTTGTLTRVLIAPVSAWEVTIGYTFAFSVIALFQAAELFLTSSLLFHVRFVGSLWIVALVILLFTITLQGIATLISTLAKNEAQAMQFVLFLVIPSIMISGVFWPLEAMPATIRPLSYVSPLTYANEALRDVMLTGAGIAEIRFELIILGGYALVMLLLAVLSMRRQAHTA